MSRRPGGPHPALGGAPWGLAHRGFTPPDHPGRPRHDFQHAWENTAESFAAALATGLRHIETDVHASADGVCVVIHDDDLGRSTDMPGLVADLPWARIARARVAGRFAVPRLDDVLADFPDAAFCIDCKVPAAAEPMAAAIRSTGAHDRVLAAAFDGRRSARVARLAPGTGRVAGIAATGAVRLAAVLARLSPAAAVAAVRAATAGIDALAVPQRYGHVPVLTPALITAAHAAGLQVLVWTVDGEADMSRLLADGVDGIITDRADLLAEVLSR